ncbi:hypothetical protein B7755_008735 [Streptomyces sp. NBS 14/10]|uniref:hypothetical protein n=1 Tax=Streptomyces sp. NBS 14/10 TaxID=1945643 RepID=UPI000B7C8DF5|nr:hypothetical protein [Streptomyces sp. NBS 14/10]KAK1178217.1 hypothetical protein B7755_008735 [Streptomyces sp. NBS 14/10]
MSDASTAAEFAPPRADCVADSAGGLTFQVVDWARPGPAAGSDAGPDAALVLVRRGADPGPEGEVRLPLVPTEGGRLQAALPSTVPLLEGRWDVHMVFGEAETQRLAPGLNDLRSLVDRKPGPSTSPLAVRIPYPTKHGNLSLRSWRRTPHAEAGELRVQGGGLAVRGRLYRVEHPAEWLAGAVAEARLRPEPSRVWTGQLERNGANAGHGADGAEFSFTLPLAELADGWKGGEEAWDLWLRPADRDAAPARLARILDDVPDKKEIFTYPAQVIAAAHGAAKAGPYYTVNNDLAVRVESA